MNSIDKKSWGLYWQFGRKGCRKGQRSNLRWPYSSKWSLCDVLTVYQISCFYDKVNDFSTNPRPLEKLSTSGWRWSVQVAGIKTDWILCRSNASLAFGVGFLPKSLASVSCFLNLSSPDVRQLQHFFRPRTSWTRVDAFEDALQD